MPIATLALVAALAASPAHSRAAGGDLSPAEPWGASDISIANGDFLPDGRMVLSTLPVFQTPVKAQVLTAPAATRPFPDAAWQNARPGRPYLDTVQGVRVDREGRAWLLDMGTRGKTTPKFVVWDARAGKLDRIVEIPPPAAIRESQLQDFVLDERRGLAVIADEAAGAGGDGSKGALVVVNLRTGQSRRLLQGRASTRAEPVDIVVDGRRMEALDPKTGKTHPMRAAADGIALDREGVWLYWGALNGRSVWRARMDDLADPKLDDAALERRVERYADKPNAGGFAIDPRGDLYMTEVEHHAVGVIPAAGRRYRRVMQDARIAWPDGVGAGPGGWLYVTDSQLPRAAAMNGGKDVATVPFRVWRFRPPADLGPAS
ncbi:MAG: hypothetical protein INR64_02650 [Caulobacteraceae bacterium]|nr:hypothetical protein [Caulobacter sp.]